MTLTTIGDPERFAIAFELTDDPDDGGMAPVRASWGRLCIWVAGRNLTLGRTADGESIDAAEVPLLPVVGWLAEHWDPLLHEERLPRPTSALSAAAWRCDVLSKLPYASDGLDTLLRDRESWWSRHSFGAALPDFRVPDLHIRRYGARVEVSWDDREWRGVPSGVVLAQRPGRALLPAEDVAGVLHAWAQAVLDAMDARGAVDSVRTAIQELRTKVLGNAALDRGEARLKWMAGVDLDSAARRLRQLTGVVGGSVADTIRAILGIGASSQPSLVTSATVPALLFRSASPHLSSSDLTVLLELARTSADAPLGLLQHQSPAPPPLEVAAITADGLERALELRAALGLPEAAPLIGEWDLEAVLLAQLQVAVRDVHLEDVRVDGVAVASAGRAPIIAINRSGRFARSPWGRRMTLAHELCHLLFDVDDSGTVGIVSNPWADVGRERRANAFAVMLLIPECALASVLPRDAETWTVNMLKTAMRQLGVGLTTLTWQLHNLGWIDDSERQAWVNELSDL